ncbi:MAG: energy transducer TonB [Treponema sp.]|nr:energy transducer TonB [Treponema sp.]
MFRVRLILFVTVAVAHAILILFLVVNVHSAPMEVYEPVLVMHLTDFDEILPPPPPPPPPPPVAIPEDVQVIEAIAEVMIEVEVVPEQVVVAAVIAPWDDFLPARRVTSPPRFNQRAIAADLVFPPQALHSGIEGRVMLELFVDRDGVVQHVRILREDPEGWGFGEAARRVFTGRRGSPAMLDGNPVPVRFRYPVTFRIR